MYDSYIDHFVANLHFILYTMALHSGVSYAFSLCCFFTSSWVYTYSQHRPFEVKVQLGSTLCFTKNKSSKFLLYICSSTYSFPLLAALGTTVTLLAACSIVKRKESITRVQIFY